MFALYFQVTGGWPYHREWRSPDGDVALAVSIPKPKGLAGLGVTLRHREESPEVQDDLVLDELPKGSAAMWLVELFPAVEPFAEW